MCAHAACWSAHLHVYPLCREMNGHNVYIVYNEPYTIVYNTIQYHSIALDRLQHYKIICTQFS